MSQLSAVPAMRIACVVGELSGDAIAAKIVAGLRRRGHAVALSGMGGPRMREQGLESPVVPLDAVSVMGIGEVLPAVPRLWLAKRRIVEHIRSERPDVVLTVDAKGFVSRVARDLSASMGHAQPPVVHAVAPTFWARARAPAEAGFAADTISRVLCLLPGEAPYFAGAAQRASFVGHPSVEDFGDACGLPFAPLEGAEEQSTRPSPRAGGIEAWHALSVAEQTRRGVGAVPSEATRVGWVRRGRARLRRRGDCTGAAPATVGLLPGSRRQERRWAQPLFAAAAARLQKERQRQGVPPLLVEEGGAGEDAGGSAAIRIMQFAGWDAALAVPGTVAMELALAGTPTALLYRAHWLTELLMRKSLRIGCASLPNLVAFDHATGPYPPGDDVLQPERLFRDATEDAAAEALGMVLAGDAPTEQGDAAVTLLAAWHRGHGLPVRFSDMAAAAVEAEVAEHARGS